MDVDICIQRKWPEDLLAADFKYNKKISKMYIPKTD